MPIWWSATWIWLPLQSVLRNFRFYYFGDGDANKPDDFVDSVDDVMAEGTLKVVDTLWYTIDGVHVSAPNRRGIYIREDRMEDGSKRTRKIMVK